MTHRHPRKSRHWIAYRYWLIDRGEGWRVAASTLEGIQRLARHSYTSIQRHIKVQGQRSVFDVDWIYWSTCMGGHPQVNQRVAHLLRVAEGQPQTPDFSLDV